MSELNAEIGAMEARAAWRAAGSPRLCPRCGGWDGPDLPFCLDGGHWTHDNTCAVYGFANDLCGSCAPTATPAEHGCANYSAPVTCLTAPSTVTARCDHCKGASDV